MSVQSELLLHAGEQTPWDGEVSTQYLSQMVPGPQLLCSPGSAQFAMQPASTLPSLKEDEQLEPGAHAPAPQSCVQ